MKHEKFDIDDATPLAPPVERGGMRSELPARIRDGRAPGFLAFPYARPAVARGAVIVILLGLLLLMPERARANAALDRAEQAFAAQRPRVARIELLNALGDTPDDARARLLQGRVYLALGNGIAAQAELERALAIGVPDNRIRPYLAHAWLLQGAPERALADADPARAAAPLAGYAARIRGRAQIVLGDLPAAGAALALAARLAPRDPEVWVDVARFRIVNGENGAAIAASQRALALAPGNVDALLLKGELARDQYGLIAAMPWFDRVLAIDPHHVPALIEKAWTEGALGRMRAMLATSRKALSVERGNPAALLLQAGLAARAGNDVLARSLIERGGDALQRNPAAMLLEGAVEYRSGNFEQAIERLGRLVALQPDNIKARRLLGAAQWRAGDARSAIEALAPVAGRADADREMIMLLARAYAAQGERALALEWRARAAAQARVARVPDARQLAGLRRAAASAPKDQRVQAALIRALIDAGQSQEALDAARALERSYPSAPIPAMLVGDAQGAAGRFADAVAAYRRAANLRFDEAVALRLVEALQRVGDPAGATRALTLFLEQNPLNVPARLVAAGELMDAGRWTQAIAMLDPLNRRLGARDATVIGALGWATYESGAVERALPLAARALALAPQDPMIAASYGWMLHETGRDKARGLLLIERGAAAAPDDPAIRWRLAQVYAAEGRADQARGAVQAALANPGFADRARAEALLARL